ncbi:MAG: hypothetical protein C4293_21190 [Nitrospiraceae bacterium]
MWPSTSPTDAPVSLTPSDLRWTAVLPETAPCIWKGDFALFTGPFLEVHDDDHHVFRRGQPLEIRSKTRKVLESSAYRPHFAIINRVSRETSGAEVSSNPDGCY